MSMKPLARGAGFTLIEILVTLVILSFGLLGLAGLVVKGHHASFEAYQRHQALTLANELAERMKSNQAGLPPNPQLPPEKRELDNNVIAALYVDKAPVSAPLGDPADELITAPDCRTTSCNRTDTAQFDMALWQQRLLGANELRADGTKGGGIINARGCVEGPLAAPSPTNSYRVSVAWQGDVPTVAPTSSACGTGLYHNSQGAVDERTRRVISVDVTIFQP